MITKKVKPILTNDVDPTSRKNVNEVIGTLIEYRFFGLLIYKKTLLTPRAFNIKEWDFTYDF